jgi:hypothetical protein
MKRKTNTQSSGRHFPLVPLTEANRRAGKHHKIVSDILSDLAKLDEFSAIKVDLGALQEKKATLRAALLRAAQKRKIQLATSSDAKHLYVFRSFTKTKAGDTGF